MCSVKNIKRDAAQNYGYKYQNRRDAAAGVWILCSPLGPSRLALELAVQALFGQTGGVRAAYDIDCVWNEEYNRFVSRGVFKKCVEKGRRCGVFLTCFHVSIKAARKTRLYVQRRQTAGRRKSGHMRGKQNQKKKLMELV